MRYVKPAAAALAGALAFAGAVFAQPQAGGVIDVATIGEPPTLDPSESTTDITGMISIHYYETLYTFGAESDVVPLLAETMPTISDDGTVYTIPLRQGVRFHDGSIMTAADVVASLERWMEVAVRGRQAAPFIDSIVAESDHAVVVTLSEPYAPLMGLLALPTSAAIILPEAVIASGSDEIVGTGPYRFVERQPDRFIRLERFADYVSRDDEPNLYGGARTAYLDEIRFVPVPNANTRIEGAIAGQYHYADSLPVESVGELEGRGNVEPVILDPFGWPVMVLNTREGALTDPAVRRALRTAISFSDMLAAAFGDERFYSVGGALYPEGFVWHTPAGTEAYDTADPAAARQMAEEAGYGGEPIRILASRQYEFHYQMSLVAAEYMRQAGFEVDLQVVDWATLTERRAQAPLWEIFFTHSPFLPEPALSGYLNTGSPGWWETPERDEVVNAFNRASDPAERAAIWADVQTLVYEQVPILKVGNFNTLAARSAALEGFTPAPWPFFWNVGLAQ